MKNICLMCYYGIASHLPPSFYPFGKFFNLCRVILLRSAIKIGNATKIQPRVYLGKGRNISIGELCEINQNVRILETHIGNFVMIAPNVNLLGGTTHPYSDTSIPMVKQLDEYVGPIVIEDDVWIGINAVVLPGVRLKKGCIVGANSVVTKDVPEYAVVGGIPAKVIKMRTGARPRK